MEDSRHTLSMDLDSEKDTIQFPGLENTHFGWTAPSLMLHLPDSCTCGCFLRIDTSPCVSPTEDELASILDDNVDMVCYENDNFLLEIFDEMSIVANTHEFSSPNTDSISEGLDDCLQERQSLIDLVCDPCLGGDVTSPDTDADPEWRPSSAVSVSSSDSFEFDIDMPQISPSPPERRSHQKRKVSHDISQTTAKHICYHGDELFSTLNRITTQTNIGDENELRYAFYTKCEDE
ncbi:uncharacterized protein LOC132543712 [Ylistrum balloti]|uniref:uncharacterized protein LOC132543712 n=1 Tax=Ylistrum balloti TaxID=509963 RepID=UPI002905B5FF|nr:uncharacterized protein LOC132543712 [Ylistrum balloti]